MSGVMAGPSELQWILKHAKGRAKRANMMGMVVGGCPSVAGGQARVPVPEAFLRVLKPAASPLRNPRSCRRMTGGDVPTTHPPALEGSPTAITLSLGDPSRVDFRLVFYPLVTPLRRDDQGLLSDEAAGFTSCAACDRHFLIPNRCIGTCSWCIAPATACTAHTTACSVYAIACTVHATSCSVHATACNRPGGWSFCRTGL